MRGRGGYRSVTRSEHPRLCGGKVLEHLLVAERAVGRFLPEPVQIHHVNGDKKDNRPQNLVVCPNDAYHRLLHLRQRALDACGNANWRKCVRCGAYAEPSAMILHSKGKVIEQYVHRECRRIYRRSYRKLKRLSGSARRSA